MASATLSTPRVDQPPPLPVRRFTVEEYLRLGEIGMLTADDQVELLEGWIVPKMIHNPAHALAIENDQELIQAVLPAQWRLRVQLPIHLDDSAPEPDFAVVRRKRQQSKSLHPTVRDVALVIEVADTTLLDDQTLKARLYARAGIPTYWIINLVDRCVEVYSDPTGPAAKPTYRKRQNYGPRKSVPLVIDGEEVAQLSVRELLP